MALVEALIALTIVVLALEIQSGQRGPGMEASVGPPRNARLLHGLWFASVLFGRRPLPTDEIPLALLGFNLGLEVGQLGVIAAAGLCFAVIRAALPSSWRSNRTAAAYIIGSLAAFWVIERPSRRWDPGLAGLRATWVDQAKRPGCSTVRGGAVLGRREVATELGGCPVFVEGCQERFRHIGQLFVEVPGKEDAPPAPRD